MSMIDITDEDLSGKSVDELVQMRSKEIDISLLKRYPYVVTKNIAKINEAILKVVKWENK